MEVCTFRSALTFGLIYYQCWSQWCGWFVGDKLERHAEADTPLEHTFVPWVTIDGRTVGAECGAPGRSPLTILNGCHRCSCACCNREGVSSACKGRGSCGHCS